METINDRIRYILEKEGHTVSSFAKKIEIGDQTIRSIVKNRNKPSYDIIVRIIKSCDWVDANWLVMGEKTNSDSNENTLYSIIRMQEKTIDHQQITIDRLTAILVQGLPDNVFKKW